MDFNEFIDTIVDCIPEYLLQFDIEKVRVEKVTKNNGVEYTGILICEKGTEISPNIYIDDYYKSYRMGYPIERICESISEEYRSAKKRIDDNLDVKLDYDSMCDKLFIKLVNYEKNKEQLKHCPYIPFFDLAITFRYLVKKNEEGIASAMVQERDLARWGKTKEEIFSIAKENTKALFPSVACKLSDLIKEKNFHIDCEYEKTDLYIITNTLGINGASYMIFEDVLNDFAKKHSSGFYILPSSIHEILLLPDSCCNDIGFLQETVREINSYAVLDTDFLSNTVYYYDKNEGFVGAARE